MRRFAILALASAALAGCDTNMAANNAVAVEEAGPAAANAAEASGRDVPADAAAPAGNEAAAAPPPPAPPPPPPPPP
ncbi:MAG TPA: hypothetical protein VGW40_15230, partial [Allosphingosinicella sp.]|nr:hypothetical protein [Allosphingosinicella sp.]